jgi:transcriptional regulator with XRE-family HTH domain
MIASKTLLEFHSMLEGMSELPKTARAALAKNVQYLMDHFNIQQTPLAKKSGVSQKTISNVLNPEGHQPKLDVVEKIASAFSLAPWHLIMDGLPEEIFGNSQMESLIENYLRSNKEGRKFISQVAERESSKYA